MATDLKTLMSKLPPGAKMALAIRLGVDPSKITKAQYGMVKNKDFNNRLRNEVIEILNASGVAQ